MLSPSLHITPLPSTINPGTRVPAPRACRGPPRPAHHPAGPGAGVAVVTLVSDAHTTGDMRERGAEFSPEQSIAVLNEHAASTKQPAATGAVTTTAEAFA